jgi:hypothetical protein
MQLVEASCDGQDNDCDGQVDEGFDLSGDVHNCGTCGNDCTDLHTGAPLGSTSPFCQGGSCDYSCLGDYYDVNGLADDGCECLDTETYPTQAAAYALGTVDDCDGVDFWVSGKLPHDSKHTGTYEEWYSFTFGGSLGCTTEWYLLFKSPSGTSMQVSLFKGTTLREFAVSTNGAVVKLSDGDLTDGTYNIRVKWLSGDSCGEYAMVMGDGCCSEDCSWVACGFQCGVDCPNF